MSLILVIVGVAVVIAVLSDVINTLVTTTRSGGRFWLTVVLYSRSWSSMRRIASRLSDEHKERLYGLFAPLSVIALLVTWVVLQIVGFALVWRGIGGIDGAASFGDSLYYSGVVYFTLGFGELVPADTVPRIGALVEAFCGVLTTALVIGYLPALYGAYSQREQKLLMLDDGTEGRITPTNLVLARSPGADPGELDAFFAEWEAWVAQVLETHTTFRMLVVFRSQHPGQNWITALGVVMDAALHVELIEGAQGRSAHWLLRRGTRLLQLLTEGVDLTEKQAELNAANGDDAQAEVRYFRPLYGALEAHGFGLVPYEQARDHATELRSRYGTELEYMIDWLDSPRGFWGHAIGDVRRPAHFLLPE